MGSRLSLFFLYLPSRVMIGFVLYLMDACVISPVGSSSLCPMMLLIICVLRCHSGWRLQTTMCDDIAVSPLPSGGMLICHCLAGSFLLRMWLVKIHILK